MRFPALNAAAKKLVRLRARKRHHAAGSQAKPPLAIAGVIPGQPHRQQAIDKSLRRKNTLQRARNVLTRGERINKLISEERWQDGRSPYGLPKVKVVKLVVKKAKKAKEEEKPEGEAAAAAAEGAPTAAHLAGKPAVTATCLHIRAAISEWLDKLGDVA